MTISQQNNELEAWIKLLQQTLASNDSKYRYNNIAHIYGRINPLLMHMNKHSSIDNLEVTEL